MSTITTPAGEWHDTRCYWCGGKGLRSDYHNDDFYGAIDCAVCDGSGFLWVSPKGRLATYPGGRFHGRAS